MENILLFICISYNYKGKQKTLEQHSLNKTEGIGTETKRPRKDKEAQVFVKLMIN